MHICLSLESYLLVYNGENNERDRGDAQRARKKGERK
jgi:hypothetical protein